jgi:hypothetical protein
VSLFEFPITFLGSSLLGCGDSFFSPPLLLVCVPGLLGGVTPPCANGQLVQEEGLVLPVSLGEGLRCTMEPG